jgi:sporulation protein YlmC with PRC-barrel domain
MIRKLMASSALLALISAGAVSVATAEDTTMTPAVTAAAPANAGDTTSAEKKLVPDTPTLATAFIGRSVYSSNDSESDNIGDVNDLIIGDDGAITDAVVGVGGFLGIGEKNVAVPFDQLKVVERDGEIRLIYAATRDQLDAAPAVDLTQYDPAKRYSEKQAAMNAALQPDAMNAPLAPAPDAGNNMAAAPAQDLTAAPADQTAAAPANQQMAAKAPATDAGTGFVSADAGQIRATALMGQQVYGPDDKSIGKVSDVVLDKDGGTRAALVDVGGFLGIGEKTVAIPFDQLQFAKVDNTAEPKVSVAMTKDQLEQLPAYEKQTAAADQNSVVPLPADQVAATPDQTAPAQAAQTAPAQTDQTAANDPANTGQMKTGAIGSDTGTAFIPQEVAASELIGASVHGVDDADVGEVSDVVFDTSGNIDAVVVDVGGFLGIGEKPIALDFKKLNISADEGGNLIVSVNATKDQLDQAPTYQVSMK